MSDDTAVLTPQFAGPAPSGPGGNVSGDTLTSGIPVVPSEDRPPSLFPGTPPGGRPGQASRVPGDPMGTGPAGPGGPAAASAPRPEPASASAPAPAKKQGRSKLVLLGVGVVGLLGVAYGAGLLMNHSDVPKGTTVLGVDIGGGTKEEGVTKLDAALGKRAVTPLQLSVDGKKTQLAPDKAGLVLDSQETVRSAAGSDYNPVSVIGSLFGGKRAVDPVIPVDKEKLGVALTDLAGVSGSANDGTIKFEPGKAVAVPGKSGKALDVDQSMSSVRDAYRAQVQTGRTKVVELPVTTREPTIGQAELDRAMKEFAKPAMSGLVTIKAGTKQIQFGPARSLPQILSMVPVNGRLVEHYDKKAIETLCDGVFDGIMITKGDGKKHQLSADDVAQAMQSALLGKTPAQRTATIGLDGNG
ncbi:peptidoglycan binding domain-containing protein [Streptomyces sp. NPDC098926]